MKKLILRINILLLLVLLSLLVVAQEESDRSIPIDTSASGAKSGGPKGTGSTMFALAHIKKGEIKEFNINKKSLPVNKISFQSKVNYVGDMTIHIKRTYDFPSKDFPKLQDANAYFEINTVNFNSDRFQNFIIEFTVEKSWLMVRKLNDEQISLYRFIDNKWVDLPTKLARIEGNNRIYEAITPGFSYFAISNSKEAVENVETKTENEVVETKIEESNEKNIIEEVSENTSEETLLVYPNKAEITSMWKETIYYWILLAAVLFILYFLGKEKEKNDKKTKKKS